MAERYTSSQVLEMLDSSEDEFEGFIEESYDSSDNEMEMSENETEMNENEMEMSENEAEMSENEVEMSENEVTEGECIYEDWCRDSVASQDQCSYTQDSSSALPSSQDSDTSDSSFPPGCTVDMSGKQPVDFVQLFLTDELLQVMIAETNKYAKDYIDSHNLPPKSRVCKWKPCTMNEMKKFLAITIGMTVDGKTRIEDYWSKSWPFATNAFSSIMSRNRFQLLLRFFHLNDSKFCKKRGQQGYDPLYKIRPLMNILLERFQKCYNLHREISVDESMIGFKGRFGLFTINPPNGE